jgi:peptidyl-dipeptidase A
LTPEYEINFLMRLALQKVAFLPFAYSLDNYRYALFRGEINPEYGLNSMWWASRVEHGGIMAAVPRSDATNLDPAAKYHIPAHTPYDRYFIGHTRALHLCDIYGREDVGERFKEMLAMGNSKPWSQILETLTDECELKSDAVLEFFQPLYTWLKQENRDQGYPVGWMPNFNASSL